MPSCNVSQMHPRDLNAIFSRPTFKSLGRGIVPIHVRKLVQDQTIAPLSGEVPLSAFFDSAYQWLSRHYRSEYVYKNEIVSRIVFGRHSPRTTSFQTEFRVGKSIADALVFNGTSTVYEIKTELDGLTRLSTQLTDYLSAFDRVFVVTHDDGLQNTLAQVPDEVGVINLTRKGSLSEVKACRSNAQHVAPAAVFNTLRRAEYLAILKQLTGWNGDVPAGMLYAAARERFAELPPQVAHDAALDAWRSRTTTGSLPTFVGQLPLSLRTLGLAEPLSGIGQLRVLECLRLPINAF